jgi:hypothetical protein
MGLLSWDDDEEEEEQIEVSDNRGETTSGETIDRDDETTESETTTDTDDQTDILICRRSSSSMSTTNQGGETTIRVTQFSGEREDFEPWLEKFYARGKRRGLKEHYLGTAGEKEGNKIAYGELVMSIDTSKPAGKIAFRCVTGTKTTDYKDGHAGNGMDNLISRYLPKTAPTLVKLYKEIYSSNSSHLKAGGDPDEWITELERVHSRMEEMGSVMTDKQFIVHVVNNVTPE